MIHYHVQITTNTIVDRIPQDVYDSIAGIHNSLRGHVGLKLCKHRFKMIRKQRITAGLPPEDAIPDRMINEFLRQCPYCQIANRLRLPIKAHRFTCASYNPFKVLHLDHIGPLIKDAHDNEYILVIIDTFSRWVELSPTKSTTAAETASVMLNHIDQGPAFHNELVQELFRLSGIEQSYTTAYSSEENGIVERTNQDVLRHIRALLFDSRINDKWSFEQLPLVQRIMNTVEKSSTGITPADLILSHSIRLTSHIISHVNSNIYIPFR